MMEIPERIKRFFASTDVALTLADMTSRDNPLVLTNRNFWKLTGYTRDQAEGQNCRFLQGNVDQPGPREEIRAALKGGHETQVILRNFRADGTAFDNLLFLYPIKADGELRYFLGSQFELRPTTEPRDVLTHDADLAERLTRVTRESSRLQIAARRSTSDMLAMLMRNWVKERD